MSETVKIKFKKDVTRIDGPPYHKAGDEIEVDADSAAFYRARDLIEDPPAADTATATKKPAAPADEHKRR